jgi:hypothetical protein
MIHTLQFTTHIARPVPEVYAHLANPHNFIGLQPLLIEMSPIQTASENGLPVQSYETVEAFRLGGRVVYRNRIRVKTTLAKLDERMDTMVHSPGGVTLDVQYHFALEDHGTRLTEIMNIHMLRLTVGFVVRQATQAQLAVMEWLKHAWKQPRERSLIACIFRRHRNAPSPTSKHSWACLPVFCWAYTRMKMTGRL